MNLSEAAATLIFLLNPDSQWAGDKVLAYKIDELLESPEVHAAAFDSWLRIREDQDVLRVSGFRMNHRLVNLDTAQIYVPLFDDWLEIREARAEMPERDMVWSFSELEADFSEEKDGVILSAKVSELTYEGAHFEFEEQDSSELQAFYIFIAEQFSVGDLGDMSVTLVDHRDYLELTIAWVHENSFSMQFQVKSAVSYRDFSRQGYEPEIWSSHVTEPVQVNLTKSRADGSPEHFQIDWSKRPAVFEPLIELVLREVPNTLNSMKGV